MATSMSPFVSVNLCCYNGELYVRHALDSIVGQTYPSWELVLIDDGSTDRTGDIVQEYVERGFPIRYYWQPNKGLAPSRNRAVELSAGEYIAFIDQDDTWKPNKLSLQMNVFASNLEARLVYSDCFLVYPSGNRIRHSRFSRMHRGFAFAAMI